MKKRNLVIASLLVLSLSVVLMGCPPEDDLEPTKFDLAMDALKDLGFKGDLIQPAGGEFHGYAKDSTSVHLAWSGQTENSYTAYKTAWATKYGTAKVNLGRAALEFADNSWISMAGLGDLWVIGDFFETAGEIGTISVPANSIVIKAYKGGN